MFEIIVDNEKCNGSGQCQSVCPKGSKIWGIGPAGGKKICQVKDKDWCLACGMCVMACPTKAITLKW